jgi:hypothetical protein
MNVWKIQLITTASYAWVGEILKEVKKKKDNGVIYFY